MIEVKKEAYTKDILLDVIGSYLAQISRNGKEYPVMVLSDLKASMQYVLEVNEYDGRYKEYLDK